MAFDEYLLFSLALSLAKRSHPAVGGLPCQKQNITPFLRLLPYELTESQKAAIREIAADMACKSGAPMSRILVGDVGCGKTVCAAIAAYIAILNGHQAAIMAPTEILARQHYYELAPLFEKLGMRTSLLLGSTPMREKTHIYGSLVATGAARTDLVIGTHALLNEKLAFADLGITITDEQHRFGVNQRAAIRQKNPAAHLLVMSATPIPRTLALVLYGDLDISRITELPKGRQRVDTHLIGSAMRDRLNGFIRATVQEGGQVYVVCPSIEEDDGSIPLGKVFLPYATQEPTKAAVEHAEELAATFPAYRVACLHGKMKPAEKDDVMQRFAAGEIHVLVSTTVIEVGVNVPNASLMIVENAERFGLSQLHQLRGRVGRGSRRSFCILVSDTKAEASRRRLQALCDTYDGYAIAEEDLRFRGPGDFFSSADDSIRQSGGLHFSALATAASEPVIAAAFSEAAAILERDRDLTSPEHRALAAEIDRLFHIKQNTFS
ncbi:MAG: DEAD/DEAH box helicase, partial [Clostridia bacterium]|nr:DEAD/DEAH box helicase [Clostridia bacterium]